jgi:hypothetical protein
LHLADVFRAQLATFTPAPISIWAIGADHLQLNPTAITALCRPVFRFRFRCQRINERLQQIRCDLVQLAGMRVFRLYPFPSDHLVKVLQHAGRLGVIKGEYNFV